MFLWVLLALVAFVSLFAAFRVCAAAYGVGPAAVDVGVGGNCV